MCPTSEQTKNVFISYVKENSHEIDLICEEFKKNHIHFWLDRKDIEPGKYWKEAIKEAINEGAFFLACFSKEYNERGATYMNEELISAVEILRLKPYDSGWFVPIKLSECDFPSVPILPGRTLNDIHYLDMYTDWEIGIKRLIDFIKK